MRGWKIGELARRVGLTVRTLHHYDRIGLFSPSHTTESGHRVYSDADVRTLLQIIALKQLGFSLGEIKAMIRDKDDDPRAMLRLQLNRLDAEITALTEVRDRVQRICDHLQQGRPVSTEEIMAVAHALALTRSPHFRPEQVEDLRQRYLALDPADQQRLVESGRRLVSEFRRCLDAGKPPDDPDVISLARRWKEATGAVLPADEPFTQAAEQYYRENPVAGLVYGMDGELYRYIKQAVSHASKN